MLGLDFDADILFGNKLLQPTDTKVTRGVYSNNMPMVEECNDRVAKECNNGQLFQCTQPILSQVRIHCPGPPGTRSHWPAPHQDIGASSSEM